MVERRTDPAAYKVPCTHAILPPATPAIDGLNNLLGFSAWRLVTSRGDDVGGCVGLINAGRKAGSIPPGPPARAMALALLGALEGAVIALAGYTADDELLAAGAVAGVLGVDSHRSEGKPYLPAISPIQATFVRRKAAQSGSR